MKCPNCNSDVDVNMKYCSSCGAKLADLEMNKPDQEQAELQGTTEKSPTDQVGPVNQTNPPNQVNPYGSNPPPFHNPSTNPYNPYGNQVPKKKMSAGAIVGIIAGIILFFIFIVFFILSAIFSFATRIFIPRKNHHYQKEWNPDYFYEEKWNFEDGWKPFN